VSGTICFVSDFGLEDTWVGVCHAVIYRDCPTAHVVDLAHQIPPFDIRKGAAVTAAGVHQLPQAIHLTVVDPGVGGARADLCLVTAQGTRLIGPDNGVLMPAAVRAGGVAAAFEIDASAFTGGPPLSTFHARDVLAPAAAAIACGREPASLGRSVEPARLAPAPFGPARVEGDHVLTEVVDIDRFGSVRLGIGAEDLETMGLRSGAFELSFGHTLLEVPFARTFADVEPGEPVALVDSSGWLTLAINTRSAAERYGIEPGVSARLRALD